MIKPRFNQNDLHKAFLKKKEAINNVLIRRLQILGERCVNHARTLNTYTDQSGNLRSSIGYAIYANSNAIQESFVGKPEGVAKAKEMASKYARKGPNEISLIVVAGMDYALYVESKGYDVLTSAEELAKRELPKMLKQLLDNIK